MKNSLAPSSSFYQILILWLLCCNVGGFQQNFYPESKFPFVQKRPQRRSPVAFVPNYHYAPAPRHKLSTVWMASPSDNFMDVEFERTVPESDQGSNSTTTANKSKSKKKESSKKSKKTTNTSDEDVNEKSLFDISLDSDPRWKEVRIPFVDHQHQRMIDGKLAFVVEVEGVTYGIAVPFDHAAAITVEDTDGSIRNMSPDDDDNEEIMEIMATQLHEQLSEDLALKRTPRILTIVGDLDQYTKDWKTDLIPDSVDVKDLLDDSDEDLQFFHDFMKRELGEEEYERTMAEPATQDSIPDEIMELFDVPGLGEREDDIDGMEEMVKSLLNEDDPMGTMRETLNASNLEHDGVALKLISYIFRNGKSYSLVKLLKPVALVGKSVKDAEGDIQFELLTPEEEELVIPKLESICRSDLEEAGLTLAP